MGRGMTVLEYKKYFQDNTSHLFLPLFYNRPALTGFMIRVIFLTAIILLSITCKSFAGGEFRKAGARSAAMGSASVTNTDVWSGFNNQATLSTIDTPVAGFYFENRFLLKELGFNAISFALPLKQGAFGLNLSYYGFELWNESKAGIAYGRKLSQRFSLGLQLDYISIRQNEFYGNKRFLTFEIGVLTQITPKVLVGAHLYNPFNSSISEYSDERSPSCLNIGVAWSLNNTFLFTTEAVKQLDCKPAINAGMECKIIPILAVRAGISTSANTFSFGAGLELKKFNLDCSTTYHNILGFSPQASLSFKF